MAQEKYTIEDVQAVRFTLARQFEEERLQTVNSTSERLGLTPKKLRPLTAEEQRWLQRGTTIDAVLYVTLQAPAAEPLAAVAQAMRQYGYSMDAVVSEIWSLPRHTGDIELYWLVAKDAPQTDKRLKRLSGKRKEKI